MIEFTDKIRKRFEIQLKKIFVGQTDLKRARPVLNQIHYSKDGHVEITNGTVAVRLSNVHHLEDSDEKYPGMVDIFKLEENAQSFKLDKELLKEFEDHLNVLYRNKVSVVRMVINKKGIYMEPNNLTEEKVYHESGIKIDLDIKEEMKFGINPRYLHDALMMIRMMKIDEVTIHKSTELRPFRITAKNLQYLIMPIRTTR